MAVHATCYNAFNTHQTTGRPAKYNSKCDYGAACKQGGYIHKGDMYSWLRTSKDGTKPFTTVVVDSNGTLEIQEKKESMSPETLEVIREASEADLKAIEAAQLRNVEKNIRFAQAYAAPTLPSAGPAPSSDPLTNAIVGAIMPAINARIDAKLDTLDASKMADSVSALVYDKVLAKVQETTALRIEIVTPTLEVKDCGLQHRLFPTLIKMLLSGCNVWLCGPSGSGKSYAAEAAAKALESEFFFQGSVTDSYALSGYNDATGRYVETALRRAWTRKSVYLQDECDACDANATCWLNNALSNNTASFPDGVIARNPECRIIAAANTWGHGATTDYVGRNKLDGAFLNRFVQLDWGYDEKLELATAGNEGWTRRVQQVRARVAEKKLRVLVTPRASYQGAKLLAAGLSQEQVEQATLRVGMTADQWSQVS